MFCRGAWPCGVVMRIQGGFFAAVGLARRSEVHTWVVAIDEDDFSDKAAIPREFANTRWLEKAKCHI